jgi:hypothetical protein
MRRRSLLLRRTRTTGRRGLVTATKKTAVILIHGIGEQRPMDTMWSFMDAAWVQDDAMVEEYDRAIYSKPGDTAENHELRRVTTRGDRHSGRRFDFHEYYWAHMMPDNRLSDVLGWLASLFVRLPGTLPSGYLGHWILAWTLTFVAAGCYVAFLLDSDRLGWASGLATLLLPIVTSLVLNAIVPVVGDAARYLRAAPRNVEARQRIRAEGMKLLARLHRTGDYDRIVVLGHSLGSLVAYDVLTHAWAGLDERKLEGRHAEGSDAMRLLADVENAGAALFEDEKADDGSLVAKKGAHDERSRFREAQRAYRRELASGEGAPWLVSDLITLGSPLGKADILLAGSPSAFETRKKRREFPICPPFYEYWAKDVKRFSFPRDAKSRIPHHAAPFAATVWSNVHFETRLLLLGDPVAGPVAPHFGPGVVDHALSSAGLRFRHLDYWRMPSGKATPAVRALRTALDLRDVGDVETREHEG